MNDSLKRAYKTALRNIKENLLDNILCNGIAKINARGDILAFSGGIANIYHISVGSEVYALKCWDNFIGEFEDHYFLISNYLNNNKMPYFIEIFYLKHGIKVYEKKYPTLRMEWVDGYTLDKFIDHNINNPDIISKTASSFYDMIVYLHDKRISHGDLQHGNIKVMPDFKLMLIDYDSLYIEGKSYEYGKICVKGHGNFQHPQRKNYDKNSIHADYFSELVIYLSLIAIATKPSLWEKYKGKESLLFLEKDYNNINSSEILKEIKQLSPFIKYLAFTLEEFCKKTSIEDLEPLEKVIEGFEKKPIISIDKTFIDFKNASIHSNTSVQLTIKNIGSGHLKCRFGQYPDWVDCKGAKNKIEVALKAKKAGDYSGTIELKSNGGNVTISVKATIYEPKQHYCNKGRTPPLYSTGLNPQLKIQEEYINFNKVYLGSNVTTIIKIQNSGGGMLDWWVTNKAHWVHTEKINNETLKITLQPSIMDLGFSSGGINIYSNGGYKRIIISATFKKMLEFNHKVIKPTLIILGVIIFISLFFAMPYINRKNEKKFWDNTKHIDSRSSYQKYLKVFKDGIFINDANYYLDSISKNEETEYWNKIVKKNTIESYQKYIDKYPKGHFIKNAQIKIEDLNWENTKRINTIDSYNKYLSEYPKSKYIAYVNEAKKNTENSLYEEVLQYNNVHYYNKFTQQFPTSERIKQLTVLSWPSNCNITIYDQNKNYYYYINNNSPVKAIEGVTLKIYCEKDKYEPILFDYKVTKDFKQLTRVHLNEKKYEIILYDNFDNNEYKWKISNKRERCEINGNKYTISTNYQTIYSLNTVNIDADKDFIIESEFVISSVKENYGYGLVWGYKDDSYHYEYIIEDGAIYYVKWNYSGSKLQFPSNYLFNKKVNDKNFVCLFRIEKIDSTISFYINNSLTSTYKFESFFGDKMGFIIKGAQTKVDINHIVVKQR